MFDFSLQSKVFSCFSRGDHPVVGTKSAARNVEENNLGHELLNASN